MHAPDDEHGLGNSAATEGGAGSLPTLCRGARGAGRGAGVEVAAVVTVNAGVEDCGISESARRAEAVPPVFPLELKALRVVAPEGWGGGWSLRPSPQRRQWMNENPNAYHCLPLVIANQWGWQVLCPTDVQVTWDGSPGPSGLTVAVDPSFAFTIKSQFGSGIVTFSLPWLFRTAPGWDLYVKGPSNRWKANCAALEGVVETWWLNYTFTLNWKLIEPGTVHFARGESLAQLVPVPHVTFDDSRAIGGAHRPRRAPSRGGVAAVETRAGRDRGSIPQRPPPLPACGRCGGPSPAPPRAACRALPTREPGSGAGRGRHGGPSLSSQTEHRRFSLSGGTHGTAESNEFWIESSSLCAGQSLRVVEDEVMAVVGGDDQSRVVPVAVRLDPVDDGRDGVLAAVDGADGVVEVVVVEGEVDVAGLDEEGERLAGLAATGRSGRRRSCRPGSAGLRGRPASRSRPRPPCCPGWARVDSGRRRCG